MAKKREKKISEKEKLQTRFYSLPKSNREWIRMRMKQEQLKWSNPEDYKEIDQLIFNQESNVARRNKAKEKESKKKT